MKKFYSLSIAALVLSLSLTGALADKIGDKAKPLHISEWVKGATAEAPVNVTDGKNVYVVEFWATWCGPCRTSIPHLTALQKQYKDKGVVFVGISNETMEEVKPFVEKQAEKMDYVVALDKERLTSDDYMRAYGQNGIPTAFIINKKGQIAWMGHPMDMDDPLEEIVTGTYDLEAAIKADEMRSKITDFVKLLREKDPKAKETGDALLKEIGKNVDLLMQMVNECYGAREYDLIFRALDQLATVDASSATRAKNIRTQIESVRLSGLYKEALAANDQEALKSIQKEVLEKLKDDARRLSLFAYEMGKLEDVKSQLSFLVSLLDAADKVEDKTLVPGPEFYRAVIYYRAGETAKGDASSEKALSTITNQTLKNQMVDYLKSIKPTTAEEKKAE